MENTRHEPSSGALKAAEAIERLVADIFDDWMRRHGHVHYPWVSREALAEIIDRETGDALLEADARLIAAAPELAAALRDLIDVASTEDVRRSVRDQAMSARAALRKAGLDG